MQNYNRTISLGPPSSTPTGEVDNAKLQQNNFGVEEGNPRKLFCCNFALSTSPVGVEEGNPRKFPPPPPQQEK
jgi:hypothetical protein